MNGKRDRMRGARERKTRSNVRSVRMESTELKTDFQKETRYSFVDAAKAVALFSVVMGHAVPGDSAVFRFIFGFHMPFFFLVAGFFLNAAKESFRDFTFKKAKKLLIPYIVFSVIGLLLIQIFPSWRTGNDFKWYLLRYFYYVQPAALGQVWFLPCLFIALLIAYGVLRLTGSGEGGSQLTGSGERKFQLTGAGKKWFPAATAVGLFAVGTLLIPAIRIPYVSRLPFKTDSAITAASFVLFGYLLMKSGLFGKIRKGFRIAGLFILPVLVYFTAVRWNGYVNICDLYYGNPVLYFLSSILGSLWILDVGSFLAASKMLCWIGRNSLWIFSIHSFFLWAWIRVYCKIMRIEVEYLSEPVSLILISLLAFFSSAFLVKIFTLCRNNGKV